MLDSATGAPETVTPDTAAPAPTEARISEKDMSTLAEKVSEAASPKTEAERAEKEAADLHAEQVKAFRRAKDGKDRDEGGKFAKPEADNARDAAKALASETPAKPETEKPDPAKAETKDQKPNEAAKPEDASPEKPAALVPKPPQSWSPDKKAVWDAMSPEAREVVAQREQEAHKAISKLGQFAKGFEPIAKTLAEYRDSFESKGVSFQDGVKQLLDAQRMLDRDPISGIQALAEAYGVNLGQSLQGQRDPAINQLQAQVDRLTSELTEARAERQQRAQTETATKQSAIEKTIADFSKDKPDFDSLEADIVANLQSLHETNPEMSHTERLQAAYERAQWANPKSRQALIERQAKDLEAKRLEEAKRAAAAARNAGAINVTSADGEVGEVDLAALQRAAFRKAANR